MSRTIRVGQGLLKVVSLSEAIERASAGDTIVVDPGVHIDDGFVIPSYLEVTIRGTDPNPRATVIQTRIGVEGNLILRNLTVKAQPYHNGLFIAGGGAVRAERCIFVREDSDQYPVVWAEGGQGVFAACSFETAGGHPERWLINSQSSAFEFHNCDIGTLSLVKSTSALVSNSQLSAVALNEDSQLTVPDQLTIVPSEFLSIRAEDRSRATIKRLNLVAGQDQYNAQIINSMLDIDAVSSQPFTVLKVDVDDLGVLRSSGPKVIRA